MFFPILFVCIVGFVTLLLSGGQHFTRRFLFVGSVLVAFLGVMFLVMLAITLSGTRPEPLPCLLISLAVVAVMLIRVHFSGGIHRLGHLWTPEA